MNTRKTFFRMTTGEARNSRQSAASMGAEASFGSRVEPPNANKKTRTRFTRAVEDFLHLRDTKGVLLEVLRQMRRQDVRQVIEHGVNDGVTSQRNFFGCGTETGGREHIDETMRQQSGTV